MAQRTLSRVFFYFTQIACIVYISCRVFSLYISDSPGPWLLPDEALLILRLMKHCAIIDLCMAQPVPLLAEYSNIYPGICEMSLGSCSQGKLQKPGSELRIQVELDVTILFLHLILQMNQLIFINRISVSYISLCKEILFIILCAIKSYLYSIFRCTCNHITENIKKM